MRRLSLPFLALIAAANTTARAPVAQAQDDDTRARHADARTQHGDTDAPRPADEVDPEREKGREAFEQGRYREALEHFRNAYRSNGPPELLCEMGETAYKLGLEEEAIAAFERYLEEVPEGPKRVQAEERLEHLRIRIEEERNRPPPPVKRERMFELGGQALIGYFTSTDPDLSFAFGLQARFGVAVIKQLVAEIGLAGVDAPKSASEGGGVLGLLGRTGVRYYHFLAGDFILYLGTGLSFDLWSTSVRTRLGDISASDTGFGFDAAGGVVFQLSQSIRVEAGLQFNFALPNDVFYEKGVFWLAIPVGASYFF